MADTITHTVGTNGVLRDYTSLSSWESDNERDLVSANEIELVVCYNDGIMTDNVAIESWTTDTTRYIKITTPLSERHHGMPYSGFRLNNGASVGIWVNDGNVWIDGIAFIGSGIAIFSDIDANPGWFKVSNCFALEVSSGIMHSADSVATLGGTLTALFWNNISVSSVWYGIQHKGAADQQVYAYNNSAYGCKYGFTTDYADNFTAKNCVALSCTTYDFNLAAVFHADSEYNASSAASGDVDKAPGSNSIYSITAEDNFTSVFSGGETLHIKDTDADIYHTGVDLSADGDLPFDDDFYQEARSVPWDIGADAYSLSPPSPVTTPQTVHTVGTNGVLRDYTSLSSWESDNQGNLTADLEGATEIAQCYNDSVMANTVTIDGWTTNASCYIKITVPLSERHHGTTYTGFRLSHGTSHAITISVGNVWVDGISFIAAGSGFPRAVYIYVTSNPGWIKVSNCFMSAAYYGIYHSVYYTFAIVGFFWNNMIVNGIAYGIGHFPDMMSYGYNNSVLGCTTAGFQGPSYANRFVVKNCIAAGNGLDFQNSANFHADSEYNASSAGSGDADEAPGSNSIYSILAVDNFTSIDPGIENLQIKDIGADIHQTGTDLF